MAEKKQSTLAKLHGLEDEMFDLLEKIRSGEIKPKEAAKRVKTANRELRGMKPRKKR